MRGIARSAALVWAALVLGGCQFATNPLYTGDDAAVSTSQAPPATDDGAIVLATSDAAASCGTRTGMRGLTQRTLTVAGLKRTYLVYLPAAPAPNKPLPFVFVFHGYTMSGQAMYDITNYKALADSEGIGLVFPDGQAGPNSSGYPWNVKNPGQSVCGGGDSASATGDDFAFIDAMKADVTADQCIDTAHTYSTGFSMGGYFAEHIGCYRSDMRAIAPASGGTLADLSACTTGHVPVILFHGTGDLLISDSCDDPHVLPTIGFTAAADLWAKKNGCATTYTTVTENGVAGLGECYVYDGCPADGQVELCTFDLMGHCWAGGDDTVPNVYACPTYANATQLEWSFFKKYAW